MNYEVYITAAAERDLNEAVDYGGLFLDGGGVQLKYFWHF